MRLHLRFAGPSTWAQVRDAFGAVATEMGAPGEWMAGPAVDSAGARFSEVGIRPFARYEYTVVMGEGDPREGYPYVMTLRLTAPGCDVGATSGGWECEPGALAFDVICADGEVHDRIRAVLATHLAGDESNRCLTAAQNAEAFMATDPARARRWIAAARGQGGRAPGESWWWSRLDQLHAALGDESPDELAARLAEGCGDMEAWFRARKHPPPGWSLDRINAMIRRLRPWSELQAPLSLPAEGWIAVPLRRSHSGELDLPTTVSPLLRAAVPSIVLSDTTTGPSVWTGDVRLFDERRCGPTAPEGGYPVAYVMRREDRYPEGWSRRPAAQREKRVPSATRITHWGLGEGDDRIIVDVQFAWEGGQPRSASLAAHWAGSPALDERVQAWVKGG